MNRATLLFAAALALPVAAAFAEDAHHKHAAVAQASAALIDGEIRKVDKEAKKITIKHGPMPKLDMPAMTMVFQVKEPSLLDKVKPGDKVHFDAEKLGGAFTVTKIQPAK